ncbi:MAG: peptidoglycan-binding protein [Methanobrevibacter arboriphilus]|uniref:Uncharacterized protein n=3 Tax=Methanobrevibacter arboriphilus TaxID=39441 RepID=A0ACA8R375_METAZ|nr:peptidoglycan-binding domain-containing protein [Methanobrevibacter arboriphilus]MBF4469717.1 peptidoglycan-binding protein [Methanobrevibacter arboriphilus]MCC7562665.1 peptidoglycan-binding protein [Methanobrevibacter arboriphilus]BBL61756.1 hypothetical protein MarbSA_07960 [Methanobrevibacter arboriphilus]GLI12769.1 hypothetical protein MARBORIA2_18590 [Methanobrevibacter arboriphilus]
MEAENINLNKIYYAVFIICVAFSIVSVSATQEMPNTKNGTSISDDKVSNNSKTIDHTLKFGDSGENVVSLQKALYSGGFYIGKIDGDFGPYTKKAVEIFQAENGLKTNGIVDEVTSSYLKKLGYLKNYNKNYDSNVVDSSKKMTSDSKNLKSNDKKSSDKSVSKDSSLKKSSSDSVKSEKSNINTEKSKKSNISDNKSKNLDNSYDESKKSSNNHKSSTDSYESSKNTTTKNTITITSLPSAGGTGLPYKWTTNTWENYCPLCGKYGGLVINPKGVYEKELTCKYCDADYCGSSGKDKAYGSRATLIRA